MSVCDCPWDSDVLGDCVMRNRTARTIPKSGNTCPNCKQPVEIGQGCVDHAGLDCEGGGFFRRFHRECFTLMEMFGERVCQGGWHYPFDLAEGAEHALAKGEHPYWRDWLYLYEETWAWTPEPPDPPDPRSVWRMGLYEAEQPEFTPRVVTFAKTELIGGRADARTWKEG